MWLKVVLILLLQEPDDLRAALLLLYLLSGLNFKRWSELEV